MNILTYSFPLDEYKSRDVFNSFILSPYVKFWGLCVAQTSWYFFFVRLVALVSYFLF